jgi:hypothetical protein
MLNLISLAIGAVAVIPLLLGLLPLLGWVNWIVLPMAVTGLIVGTLSRGSAGRNLNLVVLCVAFVRLTLGFGII